MGGAYETILINSSLQIKEYGKMIFTVFKYLDKVLPFPLAKAHCDIPCKIYDPIEAQIAALTIVRLNDLLEELISKELDSAGDKAQFGRLIAQKEEHGLKLKEAIRVIWGDYFKKPQIEAHPDIHEIVHQIMMLASKAKQNVDREASTELLQMVNNFAEIFWQTKKVATFTASCPYPPNLELVYPDLKK